MDSSFIMHQINPDSVGTDICTYFTAVPEWSPHEAIHATSQLPLDIVQPQTGVPLIYVAAPMQVPLAESPKLYGATHHPQMQTQSVAGAPLINGPLQAQAQAFWAKQAYTQANGAIVDYLVDAATGNNAILEECAQAIARRMQSCVSVQTSPFMTHDPSIGQNFSQYQSAHAPTTEFASVDVMTAPPAESQDSSESTLMMKNVPFTWSSEDLCKALCNAGLTLGKDIDFMCLVGGKRFSGTPGLSSHKGYAFINVRSPEAVRIVADAFHNKECPRAGGTGQKLFQVRMATNQGVAYYRNRHSQETVFFSEHTAPQAHSADVWPPVASGNSYADSAVFKPWNPHQDHRAEVWPPVASGDMKECRDRANDMVLLESLMQAECEPEQSEKCPEVSAIEARLLAALQGEELAYQAEVLPKDRYCFPTMTEDTTASITNSGRTTSSNEDSSGDRDQNPCPTLLETQRITAKLQPIMERQMDCCLQATGWQEK